MRAALKVRPLAFYRFLDQGLPSSRVVSVGGFLSTKRGYVDRETDRGRRVLVKRVEEGREEESSTYGFDFAISSTSFSSPSATRITSSIRPAPILDSMSEILLAREGGWVSWYVL